MQGLQKMRSGTKEVDELVAVVGHLVAGVTKPTRYLTRYTYTINPLSSSLTQPLKCTYCNTSSLMHHL